MSTIVYTPEQQKANRDKWTAALRSGRYPQGKRALLSSDDQGRQCFCCLGVACEVAVQAGVIAPPADTELNDDAGWTFEQIADLVDGDGVMLEDRR